ncbi:MAG: indole-3-glycerol-phosphate synthase TrpC, partial [Bacteroidaceae bacterium]|nr:indole-3-glycerol-phosphate synthase TrpC [Bacteroidaceae bacterium]
MDILDEIVAHKRQELCEQKAIVPPAELYQMVEREISEGNRRMLSMRESLLRSSSGIIAEFKRKSPSKGWIHEDAQVEDVTRQYVCGGASALSILTDNRYFGGDMRFIRRVRQCTDI